MNVKLIFFISLFCSIVCSTQATEEHDKERAAPAINVLPDDIMADIFNHLPIKGRASASQVCRKWEEIIETSSSWNLVRRNIHGDYPKSEATKENTKFHIFRVHANTLSESNKTKYLVGKYNINKGHPFALYQTLVNKFLSTRANEAAREKQILDLTYATYSSEKGPRSIADLFLEQSNSTAIERKIERFLEDEYSYEKNS
ncbi:F-box protein [Candidatus Odyssella acanthamoebae]|uniref:F-box domain-containing protein n=1 Tax=Candidatus Odyssella acanthamoebae TaxID=91604 RepID=A0A077B0V9_9PROT|nr:F-box protein [Candidatus Paracaedibacter acanthamoebae]AIK96575.1 hypothetical protein ID47_07330 [Candidatus Paracaedibacter acanthamoebae]